MKPMLKAPGTKRTKLNCDASIPLSTSAFRFNLRLYIVTKLTAQCGMCTGGRQGVTLVHFSAQLEPYLTHKITLHTLNTP